MEFDRKQDDLGRLEQERDIERQFKSVPKGSKIAVYGAGEWSRGVMAWLLRNTDYKLCGWYDKRHQEIGWPVSDPAFLKSAEYDYLVVAVKSKLLCDIILTDLDKHGIHPSHVLWDGEEVDIDAENLRHWDCCPICQSKDFKVRDYLGTCQECGHMFRMIVPEEVLPHYYKRSYWETDKNRQGIYSVQPSDAYTEWLSDRLDILESFGLLNHTHPEKVRILEFGCAEGMLLHVLKEKGYQVMGNDVCAIVDESSRALDIPVSNLPIEQFCLQDGVEPFDLIMSFHVVEHLCDPRYIMEKLVSLLKPGGQMLLHVPVDDMELANMDHFHFFSNKSCMKLMELFTVNIRHGLSHYMIHPEISKDATAVAATYVGYKRML